MRRVPSVCARSCGSRLVRAGSSSYARLFVRRPPAAVHRLEDLWVPKSRLECCEKEKSEIERERNELETENKRCRAQLAEHQEALKDAQNAVAVGKEALEAMEKEWERALETHTAQTQVGGVVVVACALVHASFGFPRDCEAAAAAFRRRCSTSKMQRTHYKVKCGFSRASSLSLTRAEYGRSWTRYH